jgi:hypothetical protein
VSCIQSKHPKHDDWTMSIRADSTNVVLCLKQRMYAGA